MSFAPVWVPVRVAGGLAHEGGVGWPHTILHPSTKLYSVAINMVIINNINIIITITINKTVAETIEEETVNISAQLQQQQRYDMAELQATTSRTA